MSCRHTSNKLAYFDTRIDFGHEIVYMRYITVQLICNLEICEVCIILSLSFYKYLNKKVLKNDLLYIYIKTVSTQTCITNDITCVIIISDSNIMSLFSTYLIFL